MSYAYTTVDVNPKPDINKNVARFKPATASSSQVFTPPGFALDSVAANSWNSDGVSANSWLQVDLGASYKVNKFIVRHAQTVDANFYTKDFQIQTSPNGTGGWTNLSTTTANNLQVTTHNLATATLMRYVRLNITRANAFNNQANINEFEVYASPQDNLLPFVKIKPVANITLPVNTLSLQSQALDPEGSALTYAWTKLRGGAATLQAPTNTANLAVKDLVAGFYTFRLSVKDALNAESIDTLRMQVLANPLPVVSAGRDRTLYLPNNAVVLQGSATDNVSIRSYKWTQVSGPAQANYGIDTLAALPVFDLQAGLYTFELSATDNGGAIGKGRVNVRVNLCSELPLAFAGDDLFVQLPADTVKVFGSGTGGCGSPNPAYRFVSRKRYELKDHLGNVRVVIGDEKETNLITTGFLLRAKVKNYSGYYPFGYQTQNSWAGISYRYGFNGQEKSPEIDANHTTAEFWEYDSRAVRRWNRDPETYPSISDYAVFADNPILYNDPNGLAPGPGPGLPNLLLSLNFLKFTTERNQSAKNLLATMQRLGYKPTLGDRVSAYTYSYLSSGLGNYTDQNDAAVLSEGRNLDNTKATRSDKIFAGVGIILPVVGGKVLQEMLEGVGKIGAKLLTKQSGEILNITAKNGALKFTDANKGGEGWRDFVITNDGELRVGSGHYTLSGEAESVKGAGQIYITKEGKIDAVNNNSGHYKPDDSQLRKQASLLKASGLTTSDFMVVDVTK
jgi:hypothetical protein